MSTPSSSTIPPLLRHLKGQIRHYSAPIDSSIPGSKLKFVPTSGTYPKGFAVSGTHVGVKSANTKNPDLAFIASETPAFAAAVFTRNKFQAAPVQVSKAVLNRRGGSGIRSVIINSGCANAVTGRGGVDDATAMSETASSCFSDSNDGQGPNSIVMSTGVIGQRLPIKKILSKIPSAHKNLASTHEAWLTTAKSICTTDTFPKLASTTFTLPSHHHKNTTYSLAGMTKGAGMIHPNMATLLGVLCTDAPITPTALQSLLTHAVNRSYNSISIDGDTSTNDTVAILANGAAAPDPDTPAVDPTSTPEDYTTMLEVLTKFTRHLAQLVVRDGEGATKFVEVRVRNTPTEQDAHRIASSVARSPLVKTALYGRDANWGRILCAMGYTQGLSDDPLSDLSDNSDNTTTTITTNNTNIKKVIDPTKISVSFIPASTSPSKDEGVLNLITAGEPEDVNEARAARLLQDEDLIIDVDLGTGQESSAYWFCDFSHEYVTINGDYRT